MARMTAEEVVLILSDLATTSVCEPLLPTHGAYEHAKAIVKDNLIPQWQDTPDRDGWYWCDAPECGRAPQNLKLFTLGTDSTGDDIQPIWKRWTVAGWVPLVGRVCPIGGEAEIDTNSNDRRMSKLDEVIQILVKPRVDPLFRDLCPPLSDDERERLKASIASEGVRDPICLWEGTIVDGHHRFAIAEELGVECPTREILFRDIDAAKAWIVANQLARRNLTDVQRAYLIGLEYHAIKQPVGGTKDVRPNGSSTKALGRKHGIASMTVARDANFALAVDSLPHSCRAEVLSPSFSGRLVHIMDLAAIGDEKRIRTALDLHKAGVSLRDAIARVSDGDGDSSICIACHAEKKAGKPCERCEERRASRCREPQTTAKRTLADHVASLNARQQIKAESSSFDGWHERLMELRRQGKKGDDLEFFANNLIDWLSHTPKKKSDEFHREIVARVANAIRDWTR